MELFLSVISRSSMSKLRIDQACELYSIVIWRYNSGITLHARVLYGENTHHKIEALFKALGRALAEAVKIDPSIKGVISTKGILD